MPIIVIVIVRLWRAVAATIRLLTDVEVMRALPWGYIRRLPFRSAWVGFAVACLGVSAGSLIASAFVPGAEKLAIFAAVAGLLFSYLRAVGNRRLRRS